MTDNGLDMTAASVESELFRHAQSWLSTYSPHWVVWRGAEDYGFAPLEEPQGQKRKWEPSEAEEAPGQPPDAVSVGRMAAEGQALDQYHRHVALGTGAAQQQQALSAFNEARAVFEPLSNMQVPNPVLLAAETSARVMPGTFLFMGSQVATPQMYWPLFQLPQPVQRAQSGVYPYGGPLPPQFYPPQP